MIENLVDIISVFPDESMDARVVQNSFKGAMWKFIVSSRAEGIDIILEIWCDVNLML